MRGDLVSSFIIIGGIFITGFIFYNFWCIKNKKISMWIDKKFEVTQDNYFKFQFKSSIFTCILMALFILGAVVLKLNEKYLFLMPVIFHISIYATKTIAIKRNYIAKN